MSGRTRGTTGSDVQTPLSALGFTMNAILLDDDGNPAKFFIQKDLPPGVISALTTEIPVRAVLACVLYGWL